MTLFIDAQRLASSQQETGVSTSSPQLDALTGGVNAETLYLFYGEEDLTDTLFTHLLAHGLKPTDRYPEPEAAYVIYGNYRVEHIVVDTEPLIQLIESTGQPPEDALKRVHMLVASSADQQANLTTELERLIKSSKDMRLVLVKGIIKLGRDNARKRNRSRVHEEVQRSIASLKRICAEACPGDVLRLDETSGKAYQEYPDDCWYCGCCAAECPNSAIEVIFPYLIR